MASGVLFFGGEILICELKGCCLIEIEPKSRGSALTLRCSAFRAPARAALPCPLRFRRRWWQIRVYREWIRDLGCGKTATAIVVSSPFPRVLEGPLALLLSHREVREVRRRLCHSGTAPFLASEAAQIRPGRAALAPSPLPRRVDRRRQDPG